MKQYAVAALALSLATPACSAEWWSLESSDVMFTAIDADSITKNGEYLEVWSVTIFAMPVFKVKKSKIQMIIRCKDNSFAFGTIISYDDNQTVLVQNDNIERTQEDAVSGTLSGNIVQQVCKPKSLWSGSTVKLNTLPDAAAALWFKNVAASTK